MNEKLGPAERIIQALLTHSDHMHHGRPGRVVADPTSAARARWIPVTHKDEPDGRRLVYDLRKVGKRTERVLVGELRDGYVYSAGGINQGRYQPPGIFPEVAEWMYRQIAEVWKLDNEFAARWASYAWAQKHSDLKVALAAFMLVQSRCGMPVRENGQTLFRDVDYRAVGEAMLLLSGAEYMDAKEIVRVHELLKLPPIAAVNRELGFGRSPKRAFVGRWPDAATHWLSYREANPQLLTGLVKAGFRSRVIDITGRVAQAGGGFKPSGPLFYETLRWKQKQAPTGHRRLMIGEAVKAAETWAGLSEEEICRRIELERPSWKRITGRLPSEPTRAIVAAAIEAGSLSSKDMVIATPTLEALGLLEVPAIKDRWTRAVREADDMRAANIAKNVQTKAVKEELEAGADRALAKAVEEVTRDIYARFFIDISGSMERAIDAAKAYVARFAQAFPLDRLRVAVFNTMGREITIPHASAAGVEAALRGIGASGGTSYGAGVMALAHCRPAEGQDLIDIFIGDEWDSAAPNGSFALVYQQARIQPMAFGLVRILGSQGYGTSVQQTAIALGIPCFQIDERTFTDPYAIPRVIRNLVAATPVGTPVAGRAPARQTLVDQIIKTPLLVKPTWATV